MEIEPSLIEPHRFASLVNLHLHARCGDELKKERERDLPKTLTERVKNLGQRYIELKEKYAHRHTKPLPRQTINDLWLLYITAKFPRDVEGMLREDGLYRLPA